MVRTIAYEHNESRPTRPALATAKMAERAMKNFMIEERA
jgi:hypothetical protein